MSGGVRVLLVDDHPVVRRGLHSVLSGESWVELVVEASTVGQAVREAVAGRVHVVSMDPSLPDGNGIDATRRILRAVPAARVVILTSSQDPDLVAGCLRAGACGFLLKRTDPQTVVQALRVAAEGCAVLGPQLATRVLGRLRPEPAALPAPLDRLNARELTLLERLAHGTTNQQIARHLGLSEKTVRNQLTGLFATLGVSDRFRAAMIARDAGLGGRPGSDPGASARGGRSTA